MRLEDRKSSAITSVVPTTAVSTAVQTMNDTKVGAAIITGRRTGVVSLIGVLVVAAFIASMVKGIVSVREGEGAGPTTPVSLTTAARFDPQRFIAVYRPDAVAPARIVLRIGFKLTSGQIPQKATTPR